MRIELTKGATVDKIDICRRDGSRASTCFPHKGPVPHDAVHYFVELGLGIHNGFWGLVADGNHPEEIGAMAKVAGHASASRRRTPDASVVPSIQAERIVECFEADLWGGGCEAETFTSTVNAACEQSLVPPPFIEPETMEEIRGQIATFRAQWAALPIGASCALDWPEK